MSRSERTASLTTDDAIARLRNAIHPRSANFYAMYVNFDEFKAEGEEMVGDAIDAAVRQGLLVRIAPDLVLTRSMVDRAIEVVREAGAEGSTVSSVRERLGTSRRYAVPLMEHLDSEHPSGRA